MFFTFFQPFLSLAMNVISGFTFAERRPIKATLPTPLYRSPSARLILDEDRKGDGSSMVSLGGPNNEVHHYSFKPTKQIVSRH
jgi:hypothetical protein